MEIIQYPHPTLRYKSKTIRRVDRTLKQIVAEMFDLMYAANGIGLAANQVDLPLQLFVINLAAEPDKGEELVFVNPVIDHPKGTDEAEEGCLSIPGVHGVVARPQQIHVSAYDLMGNEIDLVADGLLARAIQHEYDHLQGVLFIDRIHETGKRQLEEELHAFELDFHGKREAGVIPNDDSIRQQLAEVESRYC